MGADAADADFLLRAVKLKACADKRAAILSPDQKQLLQVAMRLMVNPRVFLEQDSGDKLEDHDENDGPGIDD